MRNFWIILITITILPASAFAKIFYSIQLSARKNIQAANKILKEAEEYPKARIDIVNSYYKVRIGLFNTYSEAKKFLIKNKIRKIFKGAFITKVDDNILKTSIYPSTFETKKNKTQEKKNAISDNKTTKFENIASKPGKEKFNSENKTFSVLLYKTNNRGNAVKFFERLPDEVKKEAFIYKENNGTYSVRVFLVKGYQNATEKEKSIEYLHFETEIKPTEKANIEKIVETKKKNSTQNKPEPASYAPKTNKPTTTKIQTSHITEKKESLPIYTIIIALTAIIAGEVLIFKFFLKRKRTSKEARDMYDILNDALKKDNTALVKEIVVPYLARYPEDIKAQELYATALEKEGRYMEAADIYFAIPEVLEGKKQFEEAEKF
ncbi:SPOR domain-containing protein [Desulfurobacterium sp.]